MTFTQSLKGREKEGVTRVAEAPKGGKKEGATRITEAPRMYVKVPLLSEN